MRLSDCFIEIIAYAAHVARMTEGEALPYEQVRANLQRLIAQSEACLETGGFNREDYDSARFAVFAWVDEAVAASQWPGRSQWQREQLQRHYFHTADAGEMFFDRLNSLGPHQRDVREIYYLCLALGFTGQYCHQGDDFLLEQLRTSNLKYLTGSSVGIPSLEKEELFPEAYAQPVPGAAGPQPKSGRWSMFTLACAAGPVVLYLLLLTVYKFILGNIGGNLIGTV
jgi:type VI secretion system protein ImpK